MRLSLGGPTFILTWDDWGGYADSVPTPGIETVPDALHPRGFQVIGRSRIPLTVFGGKVRQGTEAQWHSHASNTKTVLDLFGPRAMGVPRVDTAPTLAGRLDPILPVRPVPPTPGSTSTQPTPPSPAPVPIPPDPWPATLGQRLPDLVTLDGSHLPAATDGLVRSTAASQRVQG